MLTFSLSVMKCEETLPVLLGLPEEPCGGYIWAICCEGSLVFYGCDYGGERLASTRDGSRTLIGDITGLTRAQFLQLAGLEP